MRKKEYFGTMAQRKNYVSAEDVKKALAVQENLKKQGEPHKLIGIIMLEMGLLSSAQLLDILQTMENKQGLTAL